MNADEQHWVLLWDCYSVHKCDKVINTLKTKYGDTLHLLFIPPSCTSLLQPLDLSYNGAFKRALARLFATWLTSETRKQLKAGVNPSEFTMDLRLATLKPHFIRWVVAALRSVEGVSSAMLKGWELFEVAWPVTDAQHEDTEELYVEAYQKQRDGTLWAKVQARVQEAGEQEAVDYETDCEEDADILEELEAEMARDEPDDPEEDPEEEEDIPDIVSTYNYTTRSGRVSKPNARYS